MSRVLPDLEVLLVAYLSADEGVAAVTDRVGTRTPTSTSEPWVRLTLLDERDDQRSSAQHVGRCYVQADCYGGNERTLSEDDASNLARAVRAALYDLPNQTLAGAVVTHVKTATGRAPDTEFDPARERHIVTAQIVAHP